MQHSKIYRELRVRRIKREIYSILAVSLTIFAFWTVLTIAYLVGSNQLFICT